MTNIEITTPDWANRIRESWIGMALQYLRVHCRKAEWPVQFTSEDILHLIIKDGFPGPWDSRWMGAVFQRAKREGVIRNYEVMGVRQFRQVESRHKMPVWESATYHRPQTQSEKFDEYQYAREERALSTVRR